MREKNDNRTKWLHLRLTPGEYDKVQKQFLKTTCRRMSDYARKILLGKPITSTYRNQSLDDLMTEAIKLRNELNNIGNNFNQAVKKLHTLNQIQEFKMWIMAYEADKNFLFNKINEIKSHIQKLAEKWLQ
jgi:LytS/YehU family sensor histidine kinase